MQIHCPKCGSLIDPADINHKTQQAGCLNCGEVFDIRQEIRTEIAHRVIGLAAPGDVAPNTSIDASSIVGTPSFPSTGSTSGFNGPIWFGLIFAGFGMIFVAIGISTIILQRYRIATYQSVPAKIISAKVVSHTSTGKNGGTTYAPVISYRYTVNGHQYSSNHTMPGLETSASSKWAHSVVNQYRPGSQATAWVSPTDPTKSFLIHRLDEGPYVFALFPAIFVAIGIALTIASRHANRPVRPITSDGHGRYRIAEAGTIRGRFRLAAFITLIYYAYFGLLILDHMRINGPDLFSSIVSASCAALGLIGIYFTYRYWQQSHDFLDADLTISQPQICPGDTIQFRIRQGVLEPMQIDKLSVTIICLYDTRTKYGNKTTYSTDTAWSRSLDFPVSRMYRPGNEVDVQGEFTLTDNVTPSSPHRHWKYPRYRWHIELQACPQAMRPLKVRYPITVTPQNATATSPQAVPTTPATA